MKQAFLRLTAAVIIATVSRAAGQTYAPETPSAKPQPGLVYAGWMTISLKPLAPFSAVISQDWTLFDGTKITKKRDVVMRDGSGRVYREMQQPVAGDEKTETEIRIDDPNRHLEYLCHPNSKNCAAVEFQPITGVRRPTMADVERVHGVTLEDLGTTVISGVAAAGMRQTKIVPEESIGNDRPLLCTYEIWYSKELDIDIQLVSFDPRTGLQTRTMTEVNLGEPDPKYFEPPAGYELVDAREPMARARREQ